MRESRKGVSTSCADAIELGDMDALPLNGRELAGRIAEVLGYEVQSSTSFSHSIEVLFGTNVATGMPGTSEDGNLLQARLAIALLASEVQIVGHDRQERLDGSLKFDPSDVGLELQARRVIDVCRDLSAAIRELTLRRMPEAGCSFTILVMDDREPVGDKQDWLLGLMEATCNTFLPNVKLLFCNPCADDSKLLNALRAYRSSTGRMQTLTERSSINFRSQPVQETSR